MTRKNASGNTCNARMRSSLAEGMRPSHACTLLLIFATLVIAGAPSAVGTVDCGCAKISADKGGTALDCSAALGTDGTSQKVYRSIIDGGDYVRQAAQGYYKGEPMPYWKGSGEIFNYWTVNEVEEAISFFDNGNLGVDGGSGIYRFYVDAGDGSSPQPLGGTSHKLFRNCEIPRSDDEGLYNCPRGLCSEYSCFSLIGAQCMANFKNSAPEDFGPCSASMCTQDGIDLSSANDGFVKAQKMCVYTFEKKSPSGGGIDKSTSTQYITGITPLVKDNSGNFGCPRIKENTAQLGVLGTYHEGDNNYMHTAQGAGGTARWFYVYEMRFDGSTTHLGRCIVNPAASPYFEVPSDGRCAVDCMRESETMCFEHGDCCGALVCNPQTKACEKCLPDGAATCRDNNDCCVGLRCATDTHQCASCLKPDEQGCLTDLDCCAGLTCSESGKCEASQAQNLPPSAPSTPSIAPFPPPLLPNGKAACTAGCPPSPIPTDPETMAQATMEYRWIFNEQTLPWSATPTVFDCSASNCAEGSRIALQTRACDKSGMCSESPVSNELAVGALPSIPPPSGKMDMSYATIALSIAFFLLALAYMATFAFNLPYLRPIIQDEFVQAVATGAILLGIVGVTLAINAYVNAALPSVGAQAELDNSKNGAIGAAFDELSILEGRTITILTGLTGSSTALGREASKGIFCNFLGVGFTLVNCSPFNAYRSGVTSGSFTVSMALADIYAQKGLLTLAFNTAFVFIIPLGLFLRCFKFGRGAGGALIAVGFGFYTVYPLSILVSEKLLHGANPSEPIRTPILGTCDPSETSVDVSRRQFENFGSALTDFNQNENVAYIALVRVIFMSILQLIATLAFIRSFAHLIGSEIDVSALARIS